MCLNANGNFIPISIIISDTKSNITIFILFYISYFHLSLSIFFVAFLRFECQCMFECFWSMACIFSSQRMLKVIRWTCERPAHTLMYNIKIPKKKQNKLRDVSVWDSTFSQFIWNRYSYRSWDLNTPREKKPKILFTKNYQNISISR